MWLSASMAQPLLFTPHSGLESAAAPGASLAGPPRQGNRLGPGAEYAKQPRAVHEKNWGPFCGLSEAPGSWEVREVSLGVLSPI